MNTTTVRPLDRVLNKLNYNGSRDDVQFQCLCPNHDDQRASLSVKQGDDGKVLLHCHAGCKTEAIVSQLGLRMQDLMGPKMTKERKAKLGSLTATYDYHDEHDNLLFQALRYEPKVFRQRRPDGKGDWIWNLKGVPLVIYRLPELLAADPDAWVFIVEGEKDVDALAALGLTATCNPMGAGKWHPGYNSYLLNRRVAILPDNDEAGRTHAHTVAQSLQGVAKAVRLLELERLPDKGDVSDWLKAGGTVKELLALMETAPNYIAPLPEPHEPHTNGDDDEPPWLFDDEGTSTHGAEPEGDGNLFDASFYERYPILNGIPPETIHKWLEQWRLASATEGGRSWSAWDFIDAYANKAEREEAIPGLLPRGEVMGFVGETGAGKSWLHARMAVERATGSPVLGVYEGEAGNVLCCLTEGKEGWSRRLRAHLKLFNARRETCQVFVRDNLPELITPKGYGVKEAGGMAWFLNIRADQYRGILPPDFVLIFIDYLREASLGATENSNDDMALVMRAANQLARALNVGVLLFHHQGSNDGNGKVGRGATVTRDMAYSWFLLEGKIENGANDPAKLRCDKPPKDHPAPVPVHFTLDTKREGYPVLTYVKETAISKGLASEVYKWVKENPGQAWGRSALEEKLTRPSGVDANTWSSRIKVAFDRVREEAHLLEYPGIIYMGRKGIQFAPKEPGGIDDR